MSRIASESSIPVGAAIHTHRGRRARAFLAAVGQFIVVAPMACSSGDPAESAQGTGTIQAHLDQVPEGQYCLQLQAQGVTRNDTTYFDISPTQIGDFLLDRIAVGLVTFTGKSYATACSSLTATTVPDYVSDSVTVSVEEGVIAKLTLTMKHNGTADVNVKWEGPCPEGGASIASMKLLPQGFCIDTTEVTRAQYAAWLQTAPSTTHQGAYCAWNASFAPDASCMSQEAVCKADCDAHPQVCVDWCDAAAYCQSIGKHLCGKIGGGATAFLDHDDASKSEWYAACTSGTQFAFTYGNAWDGSNPPASSVCNDWAKALGTTSPAGGNPGCTSPDVAYSGVFDLTGNVWEWEDSCNRSTGSADACRIRGGAFTNCYGAGVCDYPYNDDRCSYSSASDGTGGNDSNPTLQRSAFDAITGFRCCAG